MTKEQVDAIIEDPRISKSLLRRLLNISTNIEELEQLACEDVVVARFCEKYKIWTGSNWRELTRSTKWV